MCLVTEHARALKENESLKLRIAELEKQIPSPIIPVTDLITISRDDYLREMRGHDIYPINLDTPLDSTLTLTSKAELDRIAPDLVYPADYYIENIWDCEDYGIQAQCDASHKFHVNGIRLGMGMTPLGYHGFAITMDKDRNIWYLEPNAGFEYAGIWFKLGEHGYNPDKIFA